ncbi:MAG: hypothetical protein K2O32_02485 [Acetatifactor sp.]|nr:hypothetical protein [Acetatifactor sp.]
MIRNTYVLSKKDAIFISKSEYYNLRNLRSILAGAVEVILGIALLIYFFPWWKAVFVYRQLVSAQDMFWLLVSLIVGWMSIILPFWMPIWRALRFYKFQVDKKHFPEIELREDGIVVKQSVEGAFSERHFEYSLLDGYVEKNHAVYIRITMQESKGYLVLHDDTYLEGSKAELLELFERKNIKQLGNLNEKNKR